MKMSKKTRIVSIVMCIALMMGIMSIGMAASAANSASPVVGWKGTDAWTSGSFSTADGIISFSANDGWSGQQFQVGTWSGGSYKAADFGTLSEGATGFVAAIEITDAKAATGEYHPTKLDAAMKISVKDKGTFIANFNGITIGGGAVQAIFPVADFAKDGDAATKLAEGDLAAVTNFELTVNTYASFWGNKVTGVKGRYSSVYAYTDTPDVITLPGVETPTTEAPTTEEPTTEEPTTEEPTTEEPTTEEPTTEEPKTDAPTTQAPVTVAPTTVAPTTVAPATQAPVVEEKEATPAKVKGVKVKAGKKKVTVTWKKAKNAKTYVVKYSYKKNMKGAKVVNAKKAKVVIKKLKSGKKVYVQVQGVNGKTKGAFSKKVAKKVK